MAIVVVTFPGLPHLFAALRLARFVPALRLLPMVAVVNHLRVAVGRVFGTAGLLYVLAILVGLVLGGGALFAYLEEGRPVADS